MPGAPVPGAVRTQELALEEPLHRALQDVRQELQACRRSLEQRVEEALQLVRPLAAALGELQEESAALRAEQERLRRDVERLCLHLGEEKDPSTLLVESGDPCAHFSGTEESGEPVAHPPTFSSTRRPSEVHLSRSGSIVSPPAPGSTKRR